MMALNPRTGAPLWRTPVDVPASMDLLTDGERVYGLDTEGHVIAVRASDGKALWLNYFDGSATRLNLFVHGFALADGNLYLAAQLPGNVGDAHGHLTNPEAVYALDSATGALRWTYRTASGDRGTLAAGGNVAYIRADDGQHAIRATDGTRLWLQADFETEGYEWGSGEGGQEGRSGAPHWRSPDQSSSTHASMRVPHRRIALAGVTHPAGCRRTSTPSVRARAWPIGACPSVPPRTSCRTLSSKRLSCAASLGTPQHALRARSWRGTSSVCWGRDRRCVAALNRFYTAVVTRFDAQCVRLAAYITEVAYPKSAQAGTNQVIASALFPPYNCVAREVPNS